MRVMKLRLDGRGRVLLPRELRALGYAPGVPMTVSAEDGLILARPEGGAAGRQPTLDRKGRLTLPGPLRSALGLRPGDLLLLRAEGPEALRLAAPAHLLGRMREARLALARRLQG